MTTRFPGLMDYPQRRRRRQRDGTTPICQCKCPKAEDGTATWERDPISGRTLRRRQENTHTHRGCLAIHAGKECPEKASGSPWDKPYA